MGLQELWFFLIAALFLGFLVLEGFDFGVGMLMVPLGAAGEGDPEKRRRAVLNTIGPVWDANEVWLITAGAAMFAAFPNWYATVFSSLYLPLLAILFAMILRIVGIEWRGKIDDPRWRAAADAGIAIGSWLPAILWGVAFAILVRGLPIDADHRVHLSIGDVLNPYTLLGGLATASLFAFYGAVFIALKTAGPIRDDAFRFARILAVPAIVLAGGFGLVDTTGARQGLDLAGSRHRGRRAVDGRGADVDQAPRRLGVRVDGGRRRRRRRAVVRFDVSEPVAVHAQPGVERDDLQRLVDPVHAEDHDLGLARPCCRW